ncbi:hypothetical protein [Arthrobacter sp. GMC3]|uniref:hypothetical protein n=1 Tax=Arthrobacter sp. GMC3 TaxID=2058894 RepID=UPI0011B04068|nr:hypothetical protein [Arthrobacter sp. GMC3]
MNRVSIPLIAGASMAVLLLGACSGQTGLKVLERAATPEDELPAIVTVEAPVDRSSSRLLATKDGVRYFALQSDDARVTCVARVPSGGDIGWQLGCGETKGSGEIVKMSSMNDLYSTILQGDDSDPGKTESGWTKISDNILISDH